MRKLVAIGGGIMRKLETLKIDEQIVSLSNNSNPKVLFIPTAGNDDPQIFDYFNEVYKNLLGCTTDVLYLLNNQLTYEEIQEKILSSDIIYMGGGSTVRLIDTFHRYKIQNLLVRAYESGIVIAGISAGAMYMFNHGISREDGRFYRINGLGFVNAFNCPHYCNNTRRNSFFGMINDSDIGIGIEDNCALLIVDNTYKVLTSSEEAVANIVRKNNNKLVTQVIEQHDQFKNLEELYQLEVSIPQMS